MRWNTGDSLSLSRIQNDQEHERQQEGYAPAPVRKRGFAHDAANGQDQ
jgi:hypothetical protein